MGLILFALLAIVVVYGIMWLNDHQDEQWTNIGKNSAPPNKTVARLVHSQCWPWAWPLCLWSGCWVDLAKIMEPDYSFAIGIVVVTVVFLLVLY